MMKSLITILLTTSIFIASGNNIDQINGIKKKAETAFSKKDFSSAAFNYELLIDSFQVNTPNIQLNLAHSYYGMDSLQKAKTVYSSISNSEAKQYASIAFQQMGKITVSESKIQLTKVNYENTSPEQISALKTALTFFKNSLKNNPTNNDSRYNYEAIAKWLKNMPEDKKEEQEKHEEEQQKKEEEQQQKREEEKDQQKKDGDEKKDNYSKNEKKEDKDSENKKEEGKDGEKKEDKNKKDKGEKSDQEKKDEKSDQEKSEESKEGEKDKKPEEDKKKEGSQEKPSEEKKKDEEGKKGEPTLDEQKKQEAKQREAQVQQRLEEHNLSKEKALQLLNSIDQQEKKYLQQQERKSNTNSNDNNKPDW